MYVQIYFCVHIILHSSLRRWAQEFESNQVLVMTAQVFVDILNHAFFSMRKVNILVIDECHAAVKDAPMKQVLTKLDQCDGKSYYCEFIHVYSM
jgi:ERCC4-related helicase